MAEDIKEKTEALVTKAGWRGLFMIELLRDDSGKLWFVELNGRPWGSMALCRRQGFEYPAWHIELAIDGQSPAGTAPIPVQSIVCRNAGREFMHLLFVLKGAKSNALTNWPPFWRTLREILHFNGSDGLYNWRQDDMKVLSLIFTSPSTTIFSNREIESLMEVLAACHVHSKWSYDGSWSLEDLSARFSRRGYRVLMMTEHDRGFSAERLDQYRQACVRASREKILVVPGIEYSDAQNRVHVLVWGPVPFLGEGLPTGQILSAVRAAGGLAIFAHPTRREAWKSFEPSWSEQLLGIEYGIASMTAGLRAGRHRHLCGNREWFHLSAWIFTPDVNRSFSYGNEFERRVRYQENIVDCLRERRCYARALGVPFKHTALTRATPLLGMAENSRRKAAAILKQSRLHFAARPEHRRK